MNSAACDWIACAIPSPRSPTRASSSHAHNTTPHNNVREQSTRLSTLEERAAALTARTDSLPRQLAETGAAPVTSREVAMLTGQVFVLRGAARALFEAPEFLWDAPDALQALYERAAEYLQLGARLDALGARCEVRARA